MPSIGAASLVKEWSARHREQTLGVTPVKERRWQVSVHGNLVQTDDDNTLAVSKIDHGVSVYYRNDESDEAIELVLEYAEAVDFATLLLWAARDEEALQ